MCGYFPLYLFSVVFFIAIKTGITEMKFARFGEKKMRVASLIKKVLAFC